MSEFKVPKGWRLVPEEPTPEMIEGAQYWHRCSRPQIPYENFRGFYDALLANAPAAPAEAEGEEVMCDICGGTGAADSGGIQPWGEAIYVDCECITKQEQFAGKLGALKKAAPVVQTQPDASVLVEALKDLLPELDEALEDLELFGLHNDQGYRKLKDWYRKMLAATKAVDAALAAKERK